MPTTERPQHSANATRDDPDQQSAGLSVLVVDDDDLVRSGVARSLTRLGYRAASAAGPEEALALLRSGHHEIALLFTDIRMPGGMDGFELAQIVRREFPHIAILLTTGFSGLRATAGERILYKPYKLADLAAAVRDSLARRK